MATGDKPGGKPRAILPRAILFDWDNTLVDSWPTILDALNTTFEAFDMAPWSMIEARERVRHSMRDSFPKLFATGGRKPERFSINVTPTFM